MGKGKLIMDLGAYIQIDTYKKIAEANGIDIPRLRGYRLMKEEKPFTEEDIETLKKDCEVDIVCALISAKPFWHLNADIWCSSEETDKLESYYLIRNPVDDGYTKYIGIRWDRIHGWKRRELKFAIKQEKKKIEKQFKTWNKYAGKEDVLYIHSRMGGDNWRCYKEKTKILNQPWFLDRVDDAYDKTYCDFYAKIEN